MKKLLLIAIGTAFAGTAMAQQLNEQTTPATPSNEVQKEIKQTEIEMQKANPHNTQQLKEVKAHDDAAGAVVPNNKQAEVKATDKDVKQSKMQPGTERKSTEVKSAPQQAKPTKSTPK